MRVHLHKYEYSLNKTVSCFLVFFLFQFNGIATAQFFRVDPSYITKQWTADDGLPVNNVVDIYQAENGYLWLATFDGLVRFDGITFTVFQSERYPGLPTNRILEIKEAADGSIWFKTEQGFIVRYLKGAFLRYTKENGLNGNLGEYIFTDHNGAVWIASSEGISLYDGNELKPYLPGIIQGKILNVFAERSGAVWFQKQGDPHLYRTENEQIRKFPYNQPPHQNVLPIFEDTENNKIWIGRENQVWTYQGGEFKKHSSIDASRNVASIAKGPKGKIWISDYWTTFYVFNQASGAWESKLSESTNPVRNGQNIRLNETGFWMVSRNFAWKEGQEVFYNSNQNYCYLVDREGSLWIGTQTQGLFKLRKNPFKTFGKREGLPHQNVYSVIEGYNHQIWAGTYRSGISILENDRVTDWAGIKSSANGGFIVSLYKGKDSTIYAGSIGAGLSWIRSGEKEFTQEMRTSPEAPFETKSYFESKAGKLWVGAVNGLFIGSPGNWKRVEEPNFSDFRARVIKEAPDGSLWLATNGAGIVHYQNNEFTFYGEEKGFTSNLIRSLHISNVKSPGHYTLWIGSEDFGLIRVGVDSGKPDLEHLTRYGTQIGMPDYAIHSIQEDETGKFWLNTNKGIFYVEKEQLEKYHRGEIEKIKGYLFTEEDGLRNREGNGGNQSAGLTASDGKIWFANQAGAVSFDPLIAGAQNKVIPPVLIESIKTSERSQPVFEGDNIKLNKEERNFEISFTSLSLVSPEKNKFRYRLSGFDDTWQDAGDRRTAIFTNIPQGSYTFEVMGSNNTGTWNPQPAMMSFRIAPYFYETAWFRFLILGIFGLSVYLAIQWRIRSVKKNELKLKQLVLERTRELEIEKKKTQEQAERLKDLDQAKTRFFTNISHELRTPLTLIMSPLQRMLSSETGTFDASSRIELERMLRNSNRLLRLIDQTLELTRLEHGKIKLQVQKLNLRDFIEKLLDIFRYVASEKEIDISFSREEADYIIYAEPDKLDKILANLISNAIKFTPVKGHISVYLNSDDDHVNIFINDNGIGLSSEEAEHIFERFYQVDSSETRSQEGSGIGLSLVSDFINLHNGTLEVDSEKDVGTTFIIKLKKGTAHFSEEELGDASEEFRLSYGNDLTRETITQYENENISPDQTTVLVAEDNEDLRSFICDILGGQYQTIEASDGKEGLQYVKKYLPDLIIADIMMPNMDGISFNRKLKDDPATASIPLIFLTAKATRENQVTGLREGGDDYITKPFDPNILKARVQNLIDARLRLRKLLNRQNRTMSSQNGSASKDPFIQKVEEIVSKSYMDPGFGVSELAGKLFLDRSQLLRNMKEKMQISPSEFIKKYRMERAAALLNENSGNISEVAYAIGFNSLSYFSYAFREYFGMSPSEYLKETEESST